MFKTVPHLALLAILPVINESFTLAESSSLLDDATCDFEWFFPPTYRYFCRSAIDGQHLYQMTHSPNFMDTDF